LHDSPRQVAQRRQLAASGLVVQRNSFEDFDTYDDAKGATIYAQELLDEQKDDRISSHFQQPFGSQEISEIYRVNKSHYGNDHITSDGDGATPLVKTDTKTVAHIDHRYPKSRGGTNHYTNAAVIPGQTNMKKSNKLEIDEEPDKPLTPYAMLALDSAFRPEKVGKHREFTSEQRKAILDANSSHYGEVRSDIDGATRLGNIDSTRVPHVDHITAKAEGGTDYYFNAAVLPASENIRKSGKKGQRRDIDYAVGEMTLVEYYEAKENGEMPFGSAIVKRY
jgi:hypothetical protein